MPVFFISFAGFAQDTLKMNELTVTSTRTGNYVENTPLKVEVLGNDEVEEKISMQPAHIAMMLTEYTGLQAQQTSSTSGNVKIRIQGLNGKYTQVLKDGFPVYGGFSGELSLMQTPPLDLRQAEIIKGSASTLYGGDAIAGIVNLISKDPGFKEELSFILNQTSRDGTDFGAFYSKRKGKLGVTLMTSGTKQTPWDVNGDLFTDIAEQERASINPRLFYYFSDSTTLTLGLYSGFETRIGGDIVAITDQPDQFHTYIERNKTSRNYSTLKFEKIFRNGDVLTIKNSLTHFNRSIEADSNRFKGLQFSSYSEATYLSRFPKHNVVTGINVVNDIFTENKNISVYDRDYTHFTVGAFAQDEWMVNKRFTLQTGMRADYQQTYGWYGLPQLAGMFKATDRFTMRLSGGLGYKIPTIFSDEAEAVTYKNVGALPYSLKAETSAGGSFDMIWKWYGDDVSLALNQTFFYTGIANPLVLNGDSLQQGTVSFVNAAKHIVTRGAESNINLTIGDLNFIAGYTFTDAHRLYDTVSTAMPLSARHRLVADLIWEDDGNWLIGAESFFTGKQELSDHTTRQAYWTFGVLIQKIVKNYRFSLNLENILDERQTRHEDIIIPPVNNPGFREVWAPLDGFMANLSVRITI